MLSKPSAPVRVEREDESPVPAESSRVNSAWHNFLEACDWLCVGRDTDAESVSEGPAGTWQLQRCPMPCWVSCSSLWKGFPLWGWCWGGRRVMWWMWKVNRLAEGQLRPCFFAVRIQLTMNPKQHSVALGSFKCRQCCWLKLKWIIIFKKPQTKPQHSK